MDADPPPQGVKVARRNTLDAIRASFVALEDTSRIVSEPRVVVNLPPVADLLANALTKELAAYMALPTDDTPEAEAARDKGYERVHAVVAAIERLPAIPTSLHAKALALAWIDSSEAVSDQKRRDEHATDGKLGFDIRQIITGQAPASEAHPDPVHALIAASRAAEADVIAFSERARGGMTEALFAEEDRLLAIQAATREATLAAVPTTRAGQVAMLDYVRFQMELYGMADGSPPEAGSPMWQAAYRTLSAALAADVDLSEPARPDLSACTIRQLWHLYDAAHSVWLHASAETQSPWCWDAQGEDYNAVGMLLAAEAERWGELHAAIASEMVRRAPATDDERDKRLGLLARHELLCNDRIADPALFAEVVQAWGGRARG